MNQYRIGIQDRADHTQKVTVERKRSGFLQSWEVAVWLDTGYGWGFKEYCSASDLGSVEAAKRLIDDCILRDRAEAATLLVGKIRYQEYP